MNGFRRLIVFASALALVLSGLLSTSAAFASGWTISTVVSGLKLPRGIAFDGRGGMYVAESGLAGSGPFGMTQGAVDKYSLGTSAQRVWSTPFAAVWAQEGPGVDVLGPAGLSAVGTGCTQASSGARNGCQILMIETLNSHEVDNGVSGHLFRMDALTGAATDRADVGDQEYEWTAAHSDLFPSDFPDSNPYGVLVTHGGSAASGNTYVIDAGANTVSVVNADGSVRVIAYIPNETPSGDLPVRDSTPTCAAEGPDGALYIGTLDLLRNFVQQGSSHVYRVDPRSGESYLTAAHLWASGLTTVTACAFDSAGNFWATEMFRFNQAGPPGDIVRIPFSNPGEIEHIGGGQLPFPGGIAQGGDGAIYVTVFSAGTNDPIGAVRRVGSSS